MPRKPKPGPEILRIETLSDGQPHLLHPAVDDFTQQPIKPKLGEAIGPIPDPMIAVNAKRKVEADTALRMLEALGIVRPKGGARLAPEPRALAHNQVKLGAHVATFPPRKFRRI